ncbi:unnamed protein product [Symbiodinium necroappetens]|uniref:Reverse transcriptase domain-containing protein n=1 Tax=Symbiodinium necroappetens TaxID=1628268 RepID=A0A812WXA6_9DINO|nr:unnamed protein product [Symbiodinium necroappetens]
MSDGGRDHALCSDDSTERERTPRDVQWNGPATLRELLPAGPPMPMLALQELRAQRDINPADGRSRSPSLDRASMGSRPEREWPMHNGDRLQGPHLPNGRFGETSSSSSSPRLDSDDDVSLFASSESSSAPAAAAVHAGPGPDAADAHAAADARADSEDGSSTWSTTTLVLAGPCLVQARNHFLGLLRLQLSATETLSSRQQGGRVGAMRRRLQQQDWQAVCEAAVRHLDGDFLARWRDYQWRSTHERRPRRPDDGSEPRTHMLLCPLRRPAVLAGRWPDSSAGREIGGVRVTSAAAAEVGPGSTEPGKHRGPVLGVTSSCATSTPGSWLCIHSASDPAEAHDRYIPARHFLLVGGDFNASVRPRRQEASLSIVPVHWRADIAGAKPLQYDKSALHAALASNAEQVGELRQQVQAAVNQVPPGDLHQLHHRVNHILCQAVRQAFPAKPAEDARISAQAGYRASARHVWRLYAQMKRARVATVGRLLQQWRFAAAFERASRALREQSRQLKRAAFQDKLGKAEAAARIGDQRRATYALFPDLPLAGPLTQALNITDEEVVSQFREIKVGKAGHTGLLSGDLTDATMAMLPKPHKPAHILANLRPIGLMAPTSKALAGILKLRMMEWQLPLLRHRPQYAYLPHRGTMDALFRVHKHVAEAIILFRTSRVTRFGAYQGQKPRPFTGALSLSLDLSRAFDLTNRPKLFQALHDYQVPPAVIEVAQRLHFGSRFLYKAGSCRSSFVTSNGLKQGCKVAPSLWVWYTLALMDALEKQLPEGWVQNVLTLFADDCWASWLLHSLDDLRKALRELTVLLSTLEAFHMQINYGKTAVLLKFVGKQAKQALHDITRMKNGVAHLCLVVNGVERLIPLKTEHDYLGSKVSYHTNGNRSRKNCRLPKRNGFLRWKPGFRFQAKKQTCHPMLCAYRHNDLIQDRWITSEQIVL